MRKVVITGGAGFIGSHLCDRLVEDGYHVHVIDNLVTGHRENLSHLEQNPRLHVHIQDINDIETLKPVYAGADWVFHLAALADIVPSMERPLTYADANVRGTFSVLESAREADVSRFIYVASSSCYGLADIFPTPETAPCNPQYPYALTKYLGEQTVLHWASVFGLPAASLRLFNVYGPRARTRSRYGAMFGVFLAQRCAGKPLTIVGDGKQTRDFTYVTDVVDAFVRVAESDVEGEALNVGTGVPTSVLSIAEQIGGDRVHIPHRPGEPVCTQADSTRVQALTGWRPKVAIEEGVGLLLARLGDWENTPVWTPHRIEEATRCWFENLGRNDAA